MEFEHISYSEKTGKNSKPIESYNFFKAAAVLAEYGFDCIRLADDWKGADFLAHHKDTGKTLEVQLKTCLVIDKKYLGRKDLYMCFTLDGTGNWYLIKHKKLLDIVRENAPRWLESKKYREEGLKFSYTATPAVRNALEEYAYWSHYGALGFRECADKAQRAKTKAQ